MPSVCLPDGSSRVISPGLTARELAESIGRKLAQAAIAAVVDGEVRDLSAPLPEAENTKVKLLTDRDPEALEVLRHSCAHIMARAVVRLFPGSQLAFGPALENGFYYDIESPTPIREEDFPRIEEEMRRLIALEEPFERFERPVDQARDLVRDMGQKLKVEHIDEDLARFPSLSFYRQGEFVDLCRGPHIPHAGKVGAFKLMSLAGAYWKGDSGRQQLQRLYATAFFSQKDLDAYLKQLEEAKKRDHRVLGKQLHLFTISPLAGPGLILWMPKGALIRGLLEQFLRDELVRRGYDPVYTPHVGRLEMYRTSGHFPYYRDAQFPPLYHHPAASALDLLQYRLASGPLEEAREREMGLFLSQASLVIPGYAEAKTPAARLEATARQAAEILRLHSISLAEFDRAVGSEAQAKALLAWLERQEGYLLKPMNCPHHIQIFKAVQRSYRDLPVRLAEFGTVYRYEQTGELSGMTRVRGFTQDDAHLFVTPEQVEEELRANIELVRFVLKTLGLGDYRVRIGLRAKGSDKYVGSDDDWNAAEAALLRIVKSLDMPHTAEEGEAAFYGPKIDFVVRDCIGREWQLGTVQLDYNLPRRFDLEYIGADNKAHRPVMIHRAPFGSMERFMGILIEHFAGAFPTWLAPEQVRVLPVSEKAAEYARGVEARLRAAGLRATSDLGSDKIGARIRTATLDKVPYMAVVGEKEAQSGGVAARDRVAGDLGTMGVEEFIARLDSEIRARRLPGG
ncbi:MAG: threonine--tRNA ligase [Planctomycetes bacterium]|nr:threonine--tRNA ligase [Planctomycetota bacterium]